MPVWNVPDCKQPCGGDGDGLGVWSNALICYSILEFGLAFIMTVVGVVWCKSSTLLGLLLELDAEALCCRLDAAAPGGDGTGGRADCASDC